MWCFNQPKKAMARGQTNDDMNSYFVDADWLDGIPEKNGQLRLTASQITNDVIGDVTADDRLRRAARMFHKALTLYHKVPECNDVATALFVSAPSRPWTSLSNRPLLAWNAVSQPTRFRSAWWNWAFGIWVRV
jgi:hypothetical protein